MRIVPLRLSITTLAVALAMSFSAVGCKKKAEAPPPTVVEPAPPPPPVDPRTVAPADVKGAPADAEKTPSGLASKVLTKGTGTEHPTTNSVVEVHYTGWTTEGKMFDSSVVRGASARFPLGGVIKGWTEGVQLMVVGEKRRLWIPAALAYGDVPARPGAPAGPLVFDVELLSFKEQPPPPQTPPDVKEPPKGAKKTKSGIYYKVLTKGTGKEHPKASSSVNVHYSGWTTDGKMFDSSVVRGSPVDFPLGGVIKGWTEGVQLMVTGEKTRFWIPGSLAYGDTPSREGAPAGMLVFDIELLSFR
jgi:peptidylprolyl isomerase